MLESYIKYDEEVFKFTNTKTSGETFIVFKKGFKLDKRFKNKEIIPINKVLRTQNRNELCNCNSGIKFKKCCGK